MNVFLLVAMKFHNI